MRIIIVILFQMFILVIYIFLNFLSTIQSYIIMGPEKVSHLKLRLLKILHLDKKKFKVFRIYNITFVDIEKHNNDIDVNKCSRNFTQSHKYVIYHYMQVVNMLEFRYHYLILFHFFVIIIYNALFFRF